MTLGSPRFSSYDVRHGVLSLVLLALLVLLPWTVGIGPNSWRTCVASTPAAEAPAAFEPSPVATDIAEPTIAPGAPPAVSATPAADAPPAVARVFFGVGKSDVPDDVSRTLGSIVVFLKAHEGRKALLSGFHDTSGRRSRNEALALDRARAVRDVLERAGIPRDRLLMARPQQTAGGGPSREARRVDVSIQ